MKGRVTGSEEQTEKERDRPSPSSIPKWLQLACCKQRAAQRSSQVSHVGRQGLVHAVLLSQAHQQGLDQKQSNRDLTRYTVLPKQEMAILRSYNIDHINNIWKRKTKQMYCSICLRKTLKIEITNQKNDKGVISGSLDTQRL